ncbi:MAG: hypothetical protein ABIJ30_12190, partial [bacterium]
AVEYKGRRELDCETYKSSRCESRLMSISEIFILLQYSHILVLFIVSAICRNIEQTQPLQD